MARLIDHRAGEAAPLRHRDLHPLPHALSLAVDADREKLFLGHPDQRRLHQRREVQVVVRQQQEAAAG